MYKEESSANAALLHNVKEVYMHVFFSLLLLSHIMLIFLTSFLSLAFVVTSISSMGIVDAPWCSGVPEDFFPYNRARTALLSNLPYDVKVCMDPLTNYAFAFYCFIY